MRYLEQRHPRSGAPRSQCPEQAMGACGPHARPAMGRPSAHHKRAARFARRSGRPQNMRHHAINSARTPSQRPRQRTFCGMHGDCRPHRDPPGSHRAWLSTNSETCDYVHSKQARFVQELGEQHSLVNPLSESNGAVIEVEIAGKRFLSPVKFSNGKYHAEELLDEWRWAMGIRKDQITRWYSELQPCSGLPFHNCESLVSSWRNAEGSFSFLSRG